LLCADCRFFEAQRDATFVPKTAAMFGSSEVFKTEGRLNPHRVCYGAHCESV